MDWSQFIPDLVATAFGVGFGIWGALWLNKRQENKEKIDNELIASQKKTDVLLNLNLELAENRRDLRECDGTDFQVGILNANLRVETWDVYSRSGELNWIDNPILLKSISDAYYLIKSIMYLSDRYFYLKMVGNKNFDETTQENMKKELEKKVGMVFRMIDMAKSRIKKVGSDKIES